MVFLCSLGHEASFVVLFGGFNHFKMLICVVQIHSECKRFGKVYGLRSVAVYGGGSMWEQAKALQEGAEIVVCTPVRTSYLLIHNPV